MWRQETYLKVCKKNKVNRIFFRLLWLTCFIFVQRELLKKVQSIRNGQSNPNEGNPNFFIAIIKKNIKIFF